MEGMNDADFWYNKQCFTFDLSVHEIVLRVRFYKVTNRVSFLTNVTFLCSSHIQKAAMSFHSLAPRNSRRSDCIRTRGSSVDIIHPVTLS